MSKGRYAPARPPKIAFGDVANFVIEHPGAWVLWHAHDDDCPTQRTQRAEDCICSPDVSLRSADGRLRFDLEGGAQ